MNKKPHSRLWLYFTTVVFTTILLTSGIVAGIWCLLYRLNVLTANPQEIHVPIAVFFFGSLLLGVVLALFAGRWIIRPIQRISDAFDEVSKGNFAVQVPTEARLTEIRDMEKHFNAMAYDLSHIETLRSDFVAGVSHEFKTPLTAIEGYAMLLQNPNLTPEKHERYVGKILDNSRQLSTLSSNILALSKLENQELIGERWEFRLDEQIRKSILLLEGKWAEKGLEFDLDLPRQMYRGSESLLLQVWNNLLDNAIKHSPEGGTIAVSLQASEETVTVTIADHGDGMSREVQHHIFEKFYQGDSSHNAEGNGLGLALVKRIVELCSGTIAVKSAPGQGASFSVQLPL